MSQLFTGVYTEKHFENLFAALQKHPTIYVVSDSNVYADLDSAKGRCRDALAVNIIKYYATITIDNCPVCAEEMESMWITIQQADRIKEEQKPVEVQFDMDAAHKAFKARLAKSSPKADEKPKGGKQK